MAITSLKERNLLKEELMSIVKDSKLESNVKMEQVKYLLKPHALDSIEIENLKFELSKICNKSIHNLEVINNLYCALLK